MTSAISTVTRPFHFVDGAIEAARQARRRPKLLVALGVGLAVAVAGTIALVSATFGGAFTSKVPVTLELPGSANAVSVGSAVEYRDITVGNVVSAAKAGPDGRVEVQALIKPGQRAAIPANVTATIAPISVFGNLYVQLTAPADPAGTLSAHQVIPAAGGATSTVQSTLGDLDHLLTQIHPAELAAGLSGIADALQGQGKGLGQTFVAGRSYLAEMLPLWPTLVADLNLLVPVGNSLAADTPDILGLLKNAGTFGVAIDQHPDQLNTVLGTGAKLADQGTGLLNAIAGPYAATVAGTGPLLQALSQNSIEVSQILTGLDTWARAWNEAEQQGPYLTLTGSPIAVANPADLVLADLGAPDAEALLNDAVHPGFVNPPTYTAADCPTYGTETGNCHTSSGGATAPASTTAATTTAPWLDPAAEKSAAASILSGLDGGTKPASASLAAVMISPLLSGMADANTTATTTTGGSR